MFENFKTDKEIKNHLEQEINKIESLDECRLYREEQFSMKEGIFKFRNLIALCNSEVKDSPYYYENLQEVKENAYIFCSEKKCKHLQKIEDKEVCKAKEVFYNRIYSPEEDKKKL